MVSDPIRVALDATALPARPAGAGVYTLELARALAARSDLDLYVASRRDLRTGTWLPMQCPGGAVGANLWEQVQFPRAARRLDCHVVHGAHLAVPLAARTPRVATVHDLTFFRLARRYQSVRRWYYRALARIAARAERIIVPSKAVAGDVVKHLGYPPERIRVIAEAPRQLPASRAPIPDRRPYLLCVGTAEPGKRAVDAVRALAAMPEEDRPELVLAGNPGPLSGALRREAQRLGLADDVTFAGYVDDTVLGSLIARATALVFPSLYEGFGLPPLEAMSLGTPVISTSAPAMTEVLGNAAVFVPPRDPAAIAREAMRLLKDPAWREELRGRGIEQAGRYSWAATAAETVAVYREVAA